MGRGPIIRQTRQPASHPIIHGVHSIHIIHAAHRVHSIDPAETIKIPTAKPIQAPKSTAKAVSVPKRTMCMLRGETGGEGARKRAGVGAVSGKTCGDSDAGDALRGTYLGGQSAYGAYGAERSD